MILYGWQIALMVLVPLFIRLVYDAVQEYRLIATSNETKEDIET